MPDIHLLRGLLDGLLHFCRDAAASMPLLVALTLVLGRRGHGSFCLAGARAMNLLGLILTCPALVLLALYLLRIMQLLREAGYSAEAYPFWSPLLLPYSLSLILWLGGMFWSVLLRYSFSGRAPTLRTNDSYGVTAIRSRLCLCALACLCFFASYVTQVWPFASLPDGMSLAQAASAIIRDKAHHYFTAMAPAGAMTLLCLPLARKRLVPYGDTTLWAKAVRWCALWAVAGYIPFWLNTSAICLGYALRDGMDVSASLLMLLLPLSGAISCWTILLAIRDPLRHFWLAYPGFGLLLLFFLQRTGMQYASMS